MLRLETFLATDELDMFSFASSSSRSVPTLDKVLKRVGKIAKKIERRRFHFFFSPGIDSSLSEIGLNIASRWEWGSPPRSLAPGYFTTQTKRPLRSGAESPTLTKLLSRPMITEA